MLGALDYIVQNAGGGMTAHGSVAEQLLRSGGDPFTMRPYEGPDGRSYINRMVQNEKGLFVPRAFVTNSPGLLRPFDWKQFDLAIVKVAKQRLRAFADLRAAGLTYTIPSGMAKTVLQTETQSDITPASVSMSPNVHSDSDRPKFDLTNLPLPIIHKNFEYDIRQIMASRQGGSPLDVSTAESASRRVAEQVEAFTLGTQAGISYGGGQIYGYANFPQRLTKTMTNPTAGGYTPATTLAEVLDMKNKSQLAFHYGPWKMYNSPLWDSYLDNDYKSFSATTLRNRIGMIDGVSAPVTADYLTGYTMLMVQQTSDVARAVIAMDMTTVQWETSPFMVNFKVMCILIPQVRADQNGNTGIVHGTAP